MAEKATTENIDVDVNDVVAAYEQRYLALCKEVAMQAAVISALHRKLKAKEAE